VSKFTREHVYIVIGYIVYMLAFYFIGITKARFEAFMAVLLLTGPYALLVKVVKIIARRK
jgi:hypothetical protein